MKYCRGDNMKLGQNQLGRPTVSVIIPNKDCPYFQEALESVLAQTYRNFEVIIILDNCSEVTKIEVSKLTNDIKVKVIIKDDGKPSIPSARNRGLKEAKGEYIAYLSADDVWYSTFLEETVGKGDIVYTDYDRINCQGNWVGFTEEKNFEYHEDFVIHLWYRCCVNLSSCLIHRKVFDKVGGFDNEILMGEDYLFYLLAAKTFKFTHLAKHLSAYRVHGLQTTNSVENLKWDEILRKKAREVWNK